MVTARRARRIAVGITVCVVSATALTACAGGDDVPSADDPMTTAPTAEADPTSPPGPTGGISAEPPAATPTGVAGEPGATQAPGSTSQEAVLDSIPGDVTGACVAADGLRDVRSGGFAAGAFDEATDAYVDPMGDDTVPLYWIPEHAEDLGRLTVRGTQVTGGNATFVEEQPTVSEIVGDTGTWHYYLTDFAIPAPGQWRLEASSGADSGCFTVTFDG
jgi:hypothetical protein